MDNSLVVKWIGFCFCVFVLTLGSCTITKHRIAAEMVEKGADPLRVTCLMWADNRDPICAIIATK